MHVDSPQPESVMAVTGCVTDADYDVVLRLAVQGYIKTRRRFSLLFSLTYNFHPNLPWLSPLQTSARYVFPSQSSTIPTQPAHSQSHRSCTSFFEPGRNRELVSFLVFFFLSALPSFSLLSVLLSREGAALTCALTSSLYVALLVHTFIIRLTSPLQTVLGYMYVCHLSRLLLKLTPTCSISPGIIHGT